MLSLESIVKEAELLITQHGFENLSMRKLAGRLNVKAMSLYNYVKNKNELIDLLLDDVVSQIELPDIKKDWKQEMLKRAKSAHSVFMKNTWALMPLLSRINSGPAMLHYLDRTLTCLHNAGFSLSEADKIMNLFDSYIYGFTLIESRFPIHSEEYKNTTEYMLPLLSQKQYPAMYALSLSLLHGDYDGKQDFLSGICIILNGLEMYLKNIGG